MKIIAITKYSFNKWNSNPRVRIIPIILFLFLYSLTSGFRDLCINNHVDAIPALFPIIMANIYYSMIIMLCLILLFCDAPFTEQNEPYVIIRSGKAHWFIGQVFYIILSSAIFVIYIFIVLLICTLPRMVFSDEWGKVYYTLAFTNAGSYYNVPFYVPSELISNYSPFFTTAICLLFTWLICCFLGSVMLMCNLLINRLLGTCIDTIIVLFSVLAPNTSGWVFYYFSPVSWLSLSKVDFIGNESLPTPAYVISFLLISTMICFFISYVVFKRKDIQILEEI